MNIVKTTTTRRWLLLLASILLAALLIFLFLPRNKGAFRAIPAQTALLLECKGLLRAKLLTEKSSNPEFKSFFQNPLATQCFEDAEAAFQLLKHDPQVLRAFAQNKALAAFSMHPADQFKSLLVLELDEDFDLEKCLKTNQLTPKYFPHQFHGNDIFNVHLSKTEQLEVAVSGRLLLFSRRATLIEDALAQLENARNWWSDRPYIADLPEAPIRLHLRPAALAEQWRGQMSDRWRGLPDLLARNVEWAGLSWDKQILKTLIETKGFLSRQDVWGETLNASIFDVLPDNTAFLARAGLRNIPDFFWQIGDGRASDFEQYILPWVGKEAAIAVTEPLSPELSGDRLLFLAVRDSVEALQKLRAYGKSRGLLPGASGQYQMFEVLGFQNSGLLKPLLGDDEAFRNPACALVGNFAVFAPDRSSLEIVLDKYLVSQTLAAHTDFLQMQQKNESEGSVSMVLNSAYLPSLLQNIFSETADNTGPPNSLISLSLQPVLGKKTDLKWASQTLTQAPAQTDILWKSVFENPVATRPYFFEQADNQSVVLAQDLKQKLYCLNAENGASLWTRPLPKPIRSEIRLINFYGNGTHCYTFSTATHLYILDEKGRDVEGYPYQLLAPATNGATVVDFDKSTHFNYFVACENGKIYGFGHQGKPLDGWNGLDSKGSVKQPILHFQHKGKDYLAVLTDSGLLSVFGRDGALRFDPVQLGEEGELFASPMQVDLNAAAPRIYVGSAAGNIYTCDLQGKASGKKAGSPGASIAFGQITGDARYESAVFSGNVLTLSAADKALAKSIKRGSFPTKNPQLFFPADQKLGMVEPRTRRIWLLNSKGELAPGFPLGGNTVFQLGQLNGVNMLVVGNGNGVLAYRMR